MAFENPLLKYSYETRGWITLASGFALHFVLGNFYLWGSISTYTTSYLNQHGSDVTKDDAGLVFPFTFFAINVGTPFGVGLANYFGWKKYIFFASILMGLSVIISSFVVGTFGLFILFYGIFFGLLVGVLYMVPFNSCYLYFPHRKGLVSGVITGGFGFGSAVFIWVIFYIVNPDNKKATQLIFGHKYFTKDITDKYPLALQVLGICILAIGCLSSFFHIRPTHEEAVAFEAKLKAQAIAEAAKKGQLKQVKLESSKDIENNVIPPFSSNPETALAVGSNDVFSGNPPEQSPSNKNRHNADYHNKQSNQYEHIPVALGVKSKEIYHEFKTFKDGAKTQFIYISIILTALYTVYGTMIVSNYKIYGEYQGFPDSFNSSVGTVGSIMNGSARIFWGFLMEKFTIMQLLLVNVTCQIAVSFTFHWVASVQALFFLWVLFGYFLYGAWLAIMPALINRIYGKKIGTQIYCFTFFGFVLASFVQYFLMLKLKPKIDWTYIFWVFSGLQLAGLIMALFVRFNADPPKYESVAKVITESVPTEEKAIVDQK